MLRYTIAAAFAAATLCALPAAAQTVGSTDSGNCYPFVCNDSGVSSGLAIDYYQTYAASAFSGTTTFDTITFFSTLYPGAEILTGDYDISFGLTSDPVGSTPTVFGSANFFTGSLGGSNLSITGNAFTYDPNLGHLVMRVLASNLPLTTNGSQANFGFMDADYTGVVTSRSYDNGGGQIATEGALVTQFSNSVVPEPATWALMLAGFGGLGAMLRVQRRRTFAAA